MSQEKTDAQLLREIHLSLVGSDLSGVGLISEVKQNTKDIKDIKSGVKKFKWTVLGVGVGAGLTGAGVKIAVIKAIALFGF